VWTVSLAAAFGVKMPLMQGMFLTMIPLLVTAMPLTPAGVAFGGRLVHNSLYAKVF
jgi:hypothetical protein